MKILFIALLLNVIISINAQFNSIVETQKSTFQQHYTLTMETINL